MRSHNGTMRFILFTTSAIIRPYTQLQVLIVQVHLQISKHDLAAQFNPQYFNPCNTLATLFHHTQQIINPNTNISCSRRMTSCIS